MITIIAGSRGLGWPELQEAIGFCPWTITRVVSGTARGIDKAGERWAKANRIPIEQFRADWVRYGRSAGYRRNVEMAENAEALLAVWDLRSLGTAHMIEIATQKKLKVFVWPPLIKEKRSEERQKA